MRAHNIGFDLLTEAASRYSARGNVLVGHPISAAMFNWEQGEGSTFISDLGKEFRFQKVYKDAEDRGLTLVSPKTGEEIVFVITDEERDRENELTAWKLVSLGSSGLPNNFLQLTIWND
jgi:hypothetical protein